jgi:hypothetical protein
VLAALREAVWSEIVVGLVECAIDGTVVCALHDGIVECALHYGTVMCALNDGTVMCALNDGMVMCAHDDGTVICSLQDTLCPFFYLHVDFVDIFGTVEVSADVGDMTLRLLTRLPEMVIDGDEMEHLLRPNVDVYPAVSN